MYFVFYIDNKKVNLNIHIVEILGKMLYLLWLSERFPRVSHYLANRISAEDPNSTQSFKTPPNLPFLTTKAASCQLAVVLSPTDCRLTVTTLYADWLLADCLHYQLLGSDAASVTDYWTHCPSLAQTALQLPPIGLDSKAYTRLAMLVSVEGWSAPSFFLQVSITRSSNIFTISHRPLSLYASPTIAILQIVSSSSWLRIFLFTFIAWTDISSALTQFPIP